MSDSSIIVNPKPMFYALHELQQQTAYFILQIHDFAAILQKLAKLTYAIGFGELIKQAEKEMNQLSHGVMAAMNALNTACKDVVNELVNKFASEGAKSDYSPPKFTDVHIQINEAYRAAIFPGSIYESNAELVKKNNSLAVNFEYIMKLFDHTKTFWTGTSADRTRQNFKNKVVPEYDVFIHVMINIIVKIDKWIVDATRFEASLGVQ